MGGEQEAKQTQPKPVPVPVCKRSDYQVGPKIGEGSFAVVHRGREVGGQQRDVAIKIVRSQEELGLRDDDPEGGVSYKDVLRSMRLEMDVMEAMGTHPNIVGLLGQDRVDHVMVMEQASSDMYKLIKKMGTEKGVPEYLMKSWAQGICAGVSHMHACGYVHQDLKSSNVLVFGDRTVKVCDFGLARKKPENMMTVDRELCTLWYRAPELLMCESVYSHKIDEWSVGCILLEMVIGGPPFRGKPECTCSCPQVTHRNFNSDQLARIFLITGSPSDKMVKRLPCQVHIRGWPKAPRKLERTVEKMMTSDRFRLGGTSAHSVTQTEMEEAVSNWSAVIGAMLELDPRPRWTCSQASEAIAKMLASEKRSLALRESMASANASPTSAPDGPKAASPNSETGRNNGSGSGAGRDTSPLAMTSPDRELPGRKIPMCYSQFNDSRHSRLGTAESTARGTTPLAHAHERTLQLRANRQARLSREAKGHTEGRAPAGFGRTRSRSLSPEQQKHDPEGEVEDARAVATRLTRVGSGGKRIPLPGKAEDRGKQGTPPDRAGNEPRARGLRRPTTVATRSRRGHSPDRLEGNFKDTMLVFEQRRVTNVSTAPASVSDGLAQAAAASGRFLQRRESANRDASRVSPTRSPTRTSRIPALARPMSGHTKLSSASMEQDGIKTLSRTSEIQPLSRTCEIDRAGRAGPLQTKDSFETRFA